QVPPPLNDTPRPRPRLLNESARIHNDEVSPLRLRNDLESIERQMPQHLLAVDERFRTPQRHERVGALGRTLIAWLQFRHDVDALISGRLSAEKPALRLDRLRKDNRNSCSR